MEKACTTELDMLRQQDVFELVDVPKGRKVINNCWVFDIKNKSMKDLGFKRLKSNAGIFLYRKKGTAVIIAIVYIDDALFCGPDIKTVKEIKAAFMNRWECRDLGPAKEFLHMNI